MPALVLSVYFHDGRYHGLHHGLPDWPPSPARLFQALVAGAARGAALEPADVEALEWLEKRGAPIIAAPHAHKGERFINYVPNNDLDAVGRDPKRVSEIRAEKTIHPTLFDAGAPLLYVWRFDRSDEMLAKRICAIADRLYQLGRGVDMAWATGEIVGDDKAIDDRLAVYNGAVCRPSGGGEGRAFAVPLNGSLQSLIARYEGGRARFKRTRSNRSKKTLFIQPPKPDFRQVAYDSSPTRVLFDLVGDKAPWQLDRIVALTEAIRGKAAERLRKALPAQKGEIERSLIGCGSTEADKLRRIRIVPLPSIGHPQADCAIRRALVEIPPDCPLPVRDLEWAFSGLHLGSDPETGEILDDSLPMLVESDDWGMPAHYGVRQNERQAFHLWRTVTPAALPERAARRRIDPARMSEEAKDAKERLEEETRAVGAVRQALRHAGIETPVEVIRVQREPFYAKGARAEELARGTRFSQHRLWHVEVAFAEPREGAVIIGDGRYLGLGLTAPEQRAFREAAVFAIEDDAPSAAARVDILTALRRALMALDRDENGTLSPLFSGHKADGSPAGNGTHEHVFLAADTDRDGSRLARLYVIRPDAADRNSRLSDDKKARFERVTGKLETVRAGPHGVLRLRGPAAPGPDDQLFARSRVWTSLTDLRPTRHPRNGADVEVFLECNICAEALRRGHPEPKVKVLSHCIGPRGGVRARLRLTFAIAVEGPLVLGCGSHMGSGLFAATDEDRHAGR